jgi:hypothetical protein
MSRFVIYKCKKCGAVAQGFDDDFLSEGWKDRVVFLTPVTECDEYEWEEIKEFPKTIHGDSGYMIDGTYFDSVETIHEATSEDLRKGADEREAKSFYDHFKQK